MSTLPLTTRLASTLSFLSRARKQRDVYRRLSEMDGHLLKDIGLTPLDLEVMRRNW